MLADPKINFAISKRGSEPGVDHLGFQVEDDSELRDMRGRLEAADRGLVEQTDQPCCYAKSDKYWITDPQGIAWETFHTLSGIPVFGEDGKQPSASSPCCVATRTDRATAASCG
jgi:hypothetical protein